MLLPFIFRYLEPCMEHTRRQCKTVVPLVPTTMLQTVCGILDGVLPKVQLSNATSIAYPNVLQAVLSTAPRQELPKGAPTPDRKLLEHHFVFACIWAFGGCAAMSKVCLCVFCGLMWSVLRVCPVASECSFVAIGV